MPLVLLQKSPLIKSNMLNWEDGETHKWKCKRFYSWYSRYKWNSKVTKTQIVIHSEPLLKYFLLVHPQCEDDSWFSSCSKQVLPFFTRKVVNPVCINNRSRKLAVANSKFLSKLFHANHFNTFTIFFFIKLIKQSEEEYWWSTNCWMDYDTDTYMRQPSLSNCPTHICSEQGQQTFQN